MHTFEIESDRQCAGSASGETHRIVRVAAHKEGVERVVVAVHRRRDVIEDLAAQLARERISVPARRILRRAA